MTQADHGALAHCVYFTLKDKAPAAQQQLIAACNKFLTDHKGTVHFGVGTRATEYQRPVNNQEFDVALVVVFESKEAHDRYQVSDRHQEFLSSQSETWANVQVFDAFV